MSITSTIKTAPASQFIYSSLSFYAPERGGEISGNWFVAALSDLGRSEAAVRQTLFRMERGGELLARKEGREKWYRASPYAEAEIEAGRRKILAPPAAAKWDGRWTVVLLRFTPAERRHRERVRAVLEVEGFAAVAPGVFVHPRDRASRLRQAAESLGVSARLNVFHGPLAGGDDAALAQSLWDVPGAAKRYHAFLRTYGRRAQAGPRSAREAFILRFAVVLDYLAVAWRDPELPPSLLPPDWPAAEAHALARRLYQRLLPAALAHAASKEKR
jgi:phenylacetic acid degradation operon negative regulatory protein